MTELPFQLKSELHKCLLCEHPACANERLQLARIVRALRFDNPREAARLLSSAECPAAELAVSQARCPVQVDFPQIIPELKKYLPAPPEPTNSGDIATEICGVKLENPFLLSSSIVSSTYDMCARAFDAGWAGAAFKTICLMEMHEASPRFAALKNWDGNFAGFKNIEELSEKPVAENLATFRRLKQNYPHKILISSIMGRDEAEWEYLTRASDEAGADVIECNFSCPNMREGGVGSDVGQDSEAVALFTAAARRGTTKPLLVKLTPNVADMRPMARAAAHAGADGIALINTIKSFTGVDLDSWVPAPEVRGLSCPGGYSGAAVKPIALRFLADLATDPELTRLHLSGMGGIQTWRDALEFMLLGAGSVQVTTAVMEYGFRIIDDLISGLRHYLQEREIAHVSALIGQAAAKVVPASELERDTVVYPMFDRARCLGCGRCYISCRDGGHQAIRFDEVTRRPQLDARKCVGCHLCHLVCPAGAIKLAPHRVALHQQH